MLNNQKSRVEFKRRIGMWTVLAVAATAGVQLALARDALAQGPSVVELVGLSTESASATFTFDSVLLTRFGWNVAVTSEPEPGEDESMATLTVLPGSDVLIETQRKRFTGGVHAQLRTMGGFMIGGSTGLLYVPNPTIRGDTVSGWRVESRFTGQDDPLTIFTLAEPQLEFGQSVQHVALNGHLVLTPAAAAHFGLSEFPTESMGIMHVEMQLLVDTGYADESVADETALALASTLGPDVIVGDLHSPNPSRRATSGTISAFALGTTACNIGDMPIGWFPMSDDAPLITSNFYRLRHNQFEQIGMSWVKYGFALAGGNLCNPQSACVPMGAGLFPPGCSDVYSISTNGFQGNLAPRSIVNPTTGVFTYTMFPHPCPPPAAACIDRLLQVQRDDLEPDLNSVARYFAEAHYITPDDAGAGNGDNNASYREVSVMENPNLPNSYSLIYTTGSTTRREMPAVLAWQEADPQVGITYIDVPGDRRFILGYRVIDLGNGQWQYEYALQNLNSDRGGQSFTVPIPEGVVVASIGFHDIADHSGVTYDTTDWPYTLNPDSLVWATETEALNDNANALRWGSLYNFRFATNTPPKSGQISVGFFKTGNPASMSANALVPGRSPLFAASNPPDGAIDARQPSELDGSAVTGWDFVQWNCLTPEVCSGLTVDEFVLTQTGGIGVAPLVIGLVPVAPDVVGVFFKDVIHEQAWSTLTTLSSEDRVRLGFLPGDVDASGITDATDVSTLIIELTAGLSLAQWSVDINRDNAFDAEDLIRLMDLFQGADAYVPYREVSLPPLP